MSVKVRRGMYILGVLILAAVIIVLIVNHYNKKGINDYEGTLVKDMVIIQQS